MITKLLIANRGEIAIRVMRTARAMGLQTVAVYSEADACAFHVRQADQAYEIGPAPARESYLNIQAILKAAKETGADAVHPGYGFLSENAEFAEACIQAGLIFVGPPAAAIRAMGLKDRAKILMRDAGVAVVPGYLGEDQSAVRLADEAAKIGYPVLIKAVAGGGGKGMRYVERAQDFDAALEGARREAKAAFGDARVLVEKFVSQPRHIEVQVFADKYGDCIHLFERDCSLQRRHQKVIEESLAPGMPESMRDAMGRAAIKAAKAVGYVGAGTVEFIADASDGLRSDRFWFMEMNTRLQVEHPVTEGVTGLDLVEWQLRVANGEHLPRSQKDVRAVGHAIEARLYAEDPDRGFLPSTGQLEYLRFPESGNGIRIDSAVQEGDYVTTYYDPMIAKLIAVAPTRSEAITKLTLALRGTQIAGVSTNAAFLIRCLSQPEFRDGTIDTAFIERFRGKLLSVERVPSPEIYAAAARFVVEEAKAAASTLNKADPWSICDSFRIGGHARESVVFVHDGEQVEVSVLYREGYLPEYIVDGSVVKCPPDVAVTRLASGQIAIMQAGATFKVGLFDPFVAAELHASTTDVMLAPMPGKVISVSVNPGDNVPRGSPLATIEAMKMEHTLVAPADVRIAGVDVVPGDQVNEGVIIVRFAHCDDDVE
ncbi:MAG: acetyl/propionyl/methylcrotonyl-CoA carboxylase subunit alpha [Alphaproteobacteria bacterium]|nr:acetyl/propionyl/methylcrotonyl-CoA carboxylase subunit alpha [Alphaproteobacteria bacterium]